LANCKFATVIGNAAQRRIDYVLKNKQDDISEVKEDPLVRRFVGVP
jgi:hypothetical protein